MKVRVEPLELSTSAKSVAQDWLFLDPPGPEVSEAGSDHSGQVSASRKARDVPQ